MKRFFLGTGLAIAAIVASAAVAAPADSVKYRQNVMKGIGGATGNIGSMLKGDVKMGPAHVREQAAVLASLSTLVKDAFAENTGTTGPTEAKPEVWSNAAGFAEKAKVLETEAAKLANLAKAPAPDMAAIGEQMKAVGGACGGCHKEFRGKT